MNQQPQPQYVPIKTAQLPLKALSAYHKRVRRADANLEQIYKLISLGSAAIEDAREEMKPMVAEALGFPDVAALRAWRDQSPGTRRWLFVEETGECILEEILTELPPKPVAQPTEWYSIEGSPFAFFIRERHPSHLVVCFEGSTEDQTLLHEDFAKAKLLPPVEKVQLCANCDSAIVFNQAQQCFQHVSEVAEEACEQAKLKPQEV